MLNPIQARLAVPTAGFKNYFGSGKFANNAARMLAGNFSAQAIAFLAAPVITRIYTPQDFGAMTLVISMISIFSVFSSLRYELAIVLPKSERKSLDLVTLSIFLCITSSLLLATIYSLFKNPISTISKLSGNENVLLLVPVGVFVYGILQILNYWFTREKAFSKLSWNQIIIQVSALPVKIGMGFWYGSSAFWLTMAGIIGQFVASVPLGVSFFKSHFRTTFRKVRKRDLIDAAIEFSDFPKYRCPNGFLMAASINLPVFLLAHFFSSATVGFFGLANTVLRRPVELVAQSMTNVFYQKIAETQFKGASIRSHLVKITAGLAAVGAIPFSTLAVAGPWIFKTIFGNEWMEAGYYAQLLAPWLFTVFICPPATQVVITMRALRFNLFFDLINIVLCACSLGIGAYLFGQPRTAVLFFSIISTLSNIYYIKRAFALTEKGL